jgi:hypothetical protein
MLADVQNVTPDDLLEVLHTYLIDAPRLVTIQRPTANGGAA